MVKIKISILLIILILTISPRLVLPQTSKEIKKQNSELLKLKSEITVLEKRLVSKSAKEKYSSEAFNTLSKQTLLLNKLINKLTKEERVKERSINKITNQIKTISKKTEALQKEYSAYVVWIYKRSLQNDLTYLFDAKSFNQALLRYKYLHIISESNKDILDNLKSKTLELNKLQYNYKIELKEKKNLVKTKKQEKQILAAKRMQKQRAIKQLKNDQDAINKEIEEKRLSELVIKKIIAKLTEKERRRQELIRTQRLKNRKVEPAIDYSYDKYESFGALKGKLNWPVSKGKIVRKFGENKNERLNTVTLNYGIDISTKKDIQAKAISSGRVSVIDWIPGYGSVIIITHKGNYRTVYGHLTDITVDEGDEITAGEVLGKVNESLEGNILHFEIWRERNYQNPVKWLVKK